MTRRVLKYKLEQIAGPQNVSIPANSKVIHFGLQGIFKDFHIWVDDVYGNSEYTLKQNFLVTGTGWEIPENYSHVSSLIDEGFVWHLFMEDDE